MKSGFGKLVIAVFIFGLGVGGAFGAGTAWGAANGAGKATSAGAQSVQGMSQADGSAGAGSGMGAMGRPAASGIVDKIEGNVLTVTTTQGATKVNIGKEATILALKQVTTDDLKAGVRVMVAGKKQADGSVNATSIQVVPDRSASGDATGASSGASSRTAGSGARTRTGSNP